MKIIFTLATTATLALLFFVWDNWSENSTSPEVHSVQSATEVKHNTTAPIIEFIDATEHDFGVVEPGQSYAHVFAIKNTGDATLELSKGRRSCDCASIEILDKEIHPGETGRVKLVWEARYTTDSFHEGFSVYTNCPNKEEILLSAHGKVKIRARATPGVFSVGLIPKGSQITQSIKLFSQTWDRMVIQDVESSLGEISYQATPLSVDDVDSLDATSGLDVAFRSDPLEEVGEFNHYVRFRVSQDEDTPADQWITMDVMAQGAIFGKYFIECDKLDYANRIDFKSVRGDQTHQCSVLIKTAEDGELPEPVFTSYPQGLQLNWKPINPAKGVYRADIQIPAGLPSGDYQQDDNQGWVQLQFDHPTLKTIRIPMVLRLYVPSEDVRY